MSQTIIPQPTKTVTTYWDGMMYTDAMPAEQARAVAASILSATPSHTHIRSGESGPIRELCFVSRDRYGCPDGMMRVIVSTRLRCVGGWILPGGMTAAQDGDRRAESYAAMAKKFNSGTREADEEDLLALNPREYFEKQAHRESMASGRMNTHPDADV